MYDMDFPGLFVVLIVAAIFYLPLILYLLTLSKALQAVSEKNRAMSPGLVWLNLIPIFELGWHFYTVIMIRNSLGAELAERGVEDPGRGGYAMGMAASILAVCGILPYVGVLASIGALICWIIYWVKIAGYKNRLLAPDQGHLESPAL